MRPRWYHKPTVQIRMYLFNTFNICREAGTYLLRICGVNNGSNDDPLDTVQRNCTNKSEQENSSITANQESANQVSAIQGSMHGKNMQLLSEELLVAVWPPNRTVMGLRVSHRIRTVLSAHGSVTLHIMTTREEFSEAVVAEWLSGAIETDIAKLRHMPMQIRATGMLLASPRSMMTVPFANMISGLHRLTSLELRSNKLDKSEMELLANSMGTLNCLEHLDLGNNHLCCDAAQCLAIVLSGQTKLQHLNVEENEIRDKGLKEVCLALQNCTMLRELIIGCNSLRHAPLHLSELVRYLKLEHLDISCNRLKDLPRLSLIFNDTSTQLCVVVMNGVEMRSKGLAKFCPGLQTCKCLQFLDLSFNRLDYCAMVHLKVVMQRCHMLTKLDLDDNQLHNIGAQELASALPLCRSLTKLKLSMNYIGDLGMRSLLCSMPLCNSLQVVTLQRNSISMGAVCRLSSHILDCKNLRLIALQDCHVPSKQDQMEMQRSGIDKIVIWKEWGE